LLGYAPLTQPTGLMSIKNYFIICILFLSAPLANANEYQNAVSENFPGYIILKVYNIDFSNADMNREEIDKVKNTANLIIGDFNNDGIPDFAAKVRNNIKKHYPGTDEYPGYDYYAGGSVACFAKGNGRYKCSFLSKTETFILPHNNYLELIPKGSKIGCLYDNINPYTGKKTENDFRLKTDAIGDFRILGLGDSVFVPLSDETFYECTHSD